MNSVLLCFSERIEIWIRTCPDTAGAVIQVAVYCSWTAVSNDAWGLFRKPCCRKQDLRFHGDFFSSVLAVTDLQRLPCSLSHISSSFNTGFSINRNTHSEKCQASCINMTITIHIWKQLCINLVNTICDKHNTIDNYLSSRIMKYLILSFRHTIKEVPLPRVHQKLYPICWNPQTSNLVINWRKKNV